MGAAAANENARNGFILRPPRPAQTSFEGLSDSRLQLAIAQPRRSANQRRDNRPPKRKRSAKAAYRPADHLAARLPHGPGWGSSALSRRRLRGGRHGGDRLEDLGSDLVGVALRVRAAVFQVALVAVVDEGMRHADGGAAVRDAVVEGGRSRGFRGCRSGACDCPDRRPRCDRAVDLEGVISFSKYSLPPTSRMYLVEKFGVHPGAVPVGSRRRGASGGEFDVDAVLLGQRRSSR